MSHSPHFRKLVLTLQQARRLNHQADGLPLPIPKSQANWTRRKFVRNAALAGGAALASTTLSHPDRVWGAGEPTIAIVGGGLAGLNAAHQLKKAGLRATVYEASDRLGGRIQSRTGGIGPGLVTDLGGSLINTDHPDMLDLIKEFKLTLFNRVRDAEKFPFPGTAYFFGNNIRPEAEVTRDLRAIARQMNRDAALLDQDYDRNAPQFDRLSAQDYLDQYRKLIPAPYIRVLLEQTMRTEYGVELRNSSALQFIGILPVVEGQSVDLLSYSDEVFSVQGGSGLLIERMAAALQGQIKTRQRLTQIQKHTTGFRLTFEPNTGVDADYVIIALPFTVLRKVNLQVTLPDEFRRFIQEGNLGANDKVFAGFDRKVWQTEQGFVGGIWTDLGFAEAWDETQRQSDRRDGALNFFLGGDQVKILETGSVQQVGTELVKRFNTAIPGSQQASTGKFLRTQWTKNPFSQGAYANFKPGQLTDFADFFYIEANTPRERQDVAFGNLIFAGEQVSDEYYGFMNGAAQTGRLAAEVVLRRIQQRS
jgi:monoamine oxidase